MTETAIGAAMKEAAMRQEATDLKDGAAYVSATVKTITPEWASRALARSPGNRPTKPGRVRRLVAAMRDGRWLLNGESIIFDRDGRLRDGHHRMIACVTAGVSIKSIVVTGVSPGAFPTIDTGIARTAGDVLHIDSAVPNANRIAAAIRWIVAYKHGHVDHHGLTLESDMVKAYCETLGPERLMKSCVAAGRSTRLLSPGMGNALHFLFAEKDEEAADQFFSDLATGVGLLEKDGVLILRQWLERRNLAKRGRGPAQQDVFARCIRAWNARRMGEPVAMLKGLVVGRDGKFSSQPTIV